MPLRGIASVGGFAMPLRGIASVGGFALPLRGNAKQNFVVFFLIFFFLSFAPQNQVLLRKTFSLFFQKIKKKNKKKIEKKN